MATNSTTFEFFAPRPCCEKHNILLIESNLSKALKYEDWEHTAQWADLIIGAVETNFPTFYSDLTKKNVKALVLDIHKFESPVLFKAHLIATISHTLLNVPVNQIRPLSNLIREHFHWAQSHNGKLDKDLKTKLGTVWQPLLKKLRPKEAN